MQNAVLGIPNGAIWRKLWPKTILEGSPKILKYVRGQILISKRIFFFEKRGILISKREIVF